MADNGFNGERQFPYPTVKKGKGYKKALQSRSQAILTSLQGFLASNYRASIPSPQYAVYLRSIALELAKLTLEWEEQSADISFEEVRPEFLYQSLGYLIFTDGVLPDLQLNDEDFREFLLTIIQIFFQGSTPQSIRDAVSLFTDETFVVKENFLEARNPNSNFDISDQFGFTVEFDLTGNQFPADLFAIQNNINLLINLVKPAHTLFKVAYVFRDDYEGPAGDDTVDVPQDDHTMRIHDYRYDDVRRYCKGMAGWDSETGYGSLGSLDVFRDDATTSPLASVREGARLVVLDGPNTGTYRVLEALDDSSVRIRPRLNVPEDPISYKIEVDRLGRNQEKYIEAEDVSGQFVSPIIFDIELDGPYTVAGGGNFTATATGNFNGDVDYVWNFGDGDLDFDDGTGASVTFTAPAGPAERLVRVKGTTADGRVRVAEAIVTIT